MQKAFQNQVKQPQVVNYFQKKKKKKSVKYVQI